MPSGRWPHRSSPSQKADLEREGISFDLNGKVQEEYLIAEDMADAGPSGGKAE